MYYSMLIVLSLISYVAFTTGLKELTYTKDQCLDCCNGLDRKSQLACQLSCIKKFAIPNFYKIKGSCVSACKVANYFNSKGKCRIGCKDIIEECREECFQECEKMFTIKTTKVVMDEATEIDLTLRLGRG
ncbi:PREDICTED: uncharacterized protein LOC105366218 [Ceratosolen solmsi marchali]|uniref:Uncharacterized protein LOC105366218 n=1 Tax=Ceratosolen solmsi marchali TaxID=326594 RepID=A0AAJ6YRJ2_9HYME|nr:PREDICTED: uncharacterized protein LOC105366218 [Ceratosolen solmsi marchali]